MTEVTRTIPQVRLNNGITIPQVGFGVYKVPAEQTHKTVETALRLGYRSIDTATLYRNEAEVGAAINDSGIAREDIFVTTKLWNTEHGYDQALRAFDASMQALQLDYVDLYLIHWPLPRHNKYVETWRALEQIYRDGRVRAIGVSNFQPEHIERLIAETDIVPAINQIELHPQLSQTVLRDFHRKHTIVTEAWGPLARGVLFSSSVITSLAAKYGKTPAQVVLRWHIQLGNVVIPKSVTPSRIAENVDIFDFELADDDMAVINELDKGRRTGPDPDVLDIS